MGTGLPTFRRGDSWSDQDSHQWNRLVDEVRGGMVTSVGPGLRMTRVPPFGTSIGLEPKLAKKIEAASGSAEVAEFNVVTSNDNVLHCNPVVDGTIDATTTIYVAKPWEHRRTSLNGKTVGGISFSNWQIFSDTVQASSGGIVEIWRISQPYAGWTIAAAHVGDVLGMKFNNEPVEWLCVQSPDHAWTFRP